MRNRARFAEAEGTAPGTPGISGATLIAQDPREASALYRHKKFYFFSKIKDAVAGEDDSVTAESIIEATPEPIFTGLLDARGNRLYRVEVRQPVGFDLTPRRR